jgi:hypothetical protein
MLSAGVVSLTAFVRVQRVEIEFGLKIHPGNSRCIRMASFNNRSMLVFVSITPQSHTWNYLYKVEHFDMVVPSRFIEITGWNINMCYAL